MRKISKARLAGHDQPMTEVEFLDSGPGRVAGSTITSWPGPPVIDLVALFARPFSGVSRDPSANPAGTTISGATPGRATYSRQLAEATVSLSDGTRITFATASL
jgi:hypothetical protein